MIDINDLLLKEAIQTWGAETQTKIVIGEIGEFLTLFGRHEQQRDSIEEWIDEIADVIIVMRQMSHILEITEEVDKRIPEKMEKLKARLLKFQTETADHI